MLYNEIIAKYQQPIGCHFEARLLKNMRKKPDHQKVKNISLAAYLSFDQTSFPSPPLFLIFQAVKREALYLISAVSGVLALVVN